MYVSSKVKRRITTMLIILLLLLVPFNSKDVSLYGCEITTYNAVLYTIVRFEAFGFTRTQLCFFPSNIDVNKNLVTLVGAFDNSEDSFNDLLQNLDN